MWGQPKLDGLQAELAARTEAGGTSDSIDGHCYFGSSADREYVVCGRFSLTRLEEETAPSADNLTDAGPVIDVGGDVNGDVDGDVESDD